MVSNGMETQASIFVLLSLPCVIIAVIIVVAIHKAISSPVLTDMVMGTL